MITVVAIGIVAVLILGTVAVSSFTGPGCLKLSRGWKLFFKISGWILAVTFIICLVIGLITFLIAMVHNLS